MDIKKRFYIITMVILTFHLIACGGSDHFNDLRQYIDEQKQKEQHSLTITKPTLSFPSIVPVTYTASKLRSPFVPNEQTSLGKDIITNPLQAYPLNMLRFVGTLTKRNVIYAYILTPDNMVYQVKEGDIIGERYGNDKFIP